MKTPVWPLIIALIFLFNMSFTQSRGRFPITFSDTNYSLAVNANNQLAIATEGGEVAFAKSVYGVWRKTIVDKNVHGPNDWVKIKSTCYFNADTALVAGEICKSDKTTRDIIYRTVNGGNNWAPVLFGFDGSVDDAAFLSNGEAWLCVAGQGIAYTKDYGATFTTFKIPLIITNIRNRYSKIYFNNKRTGIICSQAQLGNQLAYTNDNCKHWTIIPTPYSQKKYKRANDDGLKEINRVAIYKDYFLVSQENQVFYSKTDKIQWELLRGYKDFYTDAENRALFFERTNGGFVKCDSRLNEVKAFASITNYTCAVSENGCLYVLGKDTLWQINRHNQLAEFPLYTNVKSVAASPVKFGYSNYHKQLAHIGNNIYQRNDARWVYAFTLPFATGSACLNVYDWETIVCPRGDSVFYYNMSNGKVSKSSARQTIGNFAAAGIKRIIFNHGHYACAGSYDEKQGYTRNGDQFVTEQRGRGQDIFPEAIDARPVDDFLKKMPAIFSKQACIDDLAFTQAEYDSCKINILKYKSMYESDDKEHYNPFTYGNNKPNFTKYLMLVDSVKTIDQELLNWYFISQRTWSTARNATKIIFVNNNDEELQIENQEYYNAFHFPWHLKLNGLYAVNTAIEINQFLQAVNPGFLNYLNKRISYNMQKDVRVYDILRLTKFLYGERE